MVLKLSGLLLVIGVLSVGFLTTLAAQAQQRITSPNYTIDASVGNSLGGNTSSPNYAMVSSGGEAVIGNGSSGSYKLGQGYVAQLNQSIQLNVHQATLQRQYSFDTPASLVAYDDSINTQNATLQNDPVWTTGIRNGGLLLDGVNDYVQASSSSLPTSINVSAWVKLTSINKKHAVVTNAKSIDGITPDGWQLGVGSDNKAYFKLCGSTSCVTVKTNGTVVAGQWYFLAGRYTPYPAPLTNFKAAIYLNGNFQEVDHPEAVLYATPRNILIGKQINDGNISADFLNGVVDEVRLYSAALGQKEMLANYNAQKDDLPEPTFAGFPLPGVSNNRNVRAIVQTDAPGYSIAISQDHDLQKGTDTIGPVSGSITTPSSWTEGSTTGLGFSLVGGVNLPPKWGSNPDYSYAAIPNTDTTFYSRSGYSGGVKDGLTMQMRLGVDYTHPAGDYQNTVTYTATIIP